MPKKRDSVWLLVLVLIRVSAAAQDARRNREPYLIPPVVHVGDQAALVIPLAGDGAAKDSVISLDARNIPRSPDIDLHRVALERRPSGGRLMIEFAAFVPGVLELPPIEIGGERFADLHVEISSILGSGESGAVLSGPAPPLAVPGTSFLVYGTMGGFVLFLLLALWLGVWGRRHFKGWISRWKRRQLIVSMWGVEKRLRRALLKEGKCRDILNSLSREFRRFLSFFTGENCRAMTAAELGRLPPILLVTEHGGAQESGAFLGAFFHRCDELRFSGSDIAAGDVLSMLSDLRRFLKNLDRAERGKPLTQDEAA